MSMSTPFEPEPPEDRGPQSEEDEVDDLEQPDIDDEAEAADPDGVAAAAKASRGDFRPPRPGDRLSFSELEEDLPES